MPQNRGSPFKNDPCVSLTPNPVSVKHRRRGPTVFKGPFKGPPAVLARSLQQHPRLRIFSVIPPEFTEPMGWGSAGPVAGRNQAWVTLSLLGMWPQGVWPTVPGWRACSAETGTIPGKLGWWLTKRTAVFHLWRHWGLLRSTDFFPSPGALLPISVLGLQPREDARLTLW